MLNHTVPNLKNSTSISSGQRMHALMEELFPICRSITGNGVRQTLGMLSRHVPLTIHEIPSGTKCFDWIIPPEWNIRDAYIIAPNGKKIVDFKKNNLHVLSYSTPIKAKISLDELNSHLYSIPEQPDAIPYITSYYKERWGFCMSHNQRKALEPGNYEVCVDSELSPGSLTYGDIVIPGRSKQEVLLSSYCCHPSLANNELSGPVVTAFLARYLLNQTDLRYSYRIIIAPETIGAIAYLSKHISEMQERVIAGYVVTCVGAPGPFSYQATPEANLLVDRVSRHILKQRGSFQEFDFTERGSDERQYAWPTVGLPVGSISHCRYNQYPEYHNSGDNMSFVTPEALEESLNVYKNCIQILEKNEVYLPTTYAEPQLGRRGLYPDIGTTDNVNMARLIVNVLGLSNGKSDLLEIADRLRVSMFDLTEVTERLVQNNLLQKVTLTKA